MHWMSSWTFISTVWWVLSQVNHSHPLNIGPNGISMTLWVTNRCLNASFALILTVKKVLLITLLLLRRSLLFVAIYRCFSRPFHVYLANKRMITFPFSFRCRSQSLIIFHSQNQFEIFHSALLEKRLVKSSTDFFFSIFFILSCSPVANFVGLNVLFDFCVYVWVCSFHNIQMILERLFEINRKESLLGAKYFKSIKCGFECHSYSIQSVVLPYVFRYCAIKKELVLCLMSYANMCVMDLCYNLFTFCFRSQTSGYGL